MSWTKLAPIVKSTGRPMASASIVVNKDGVPKVSLILSASLKDEFGDRGERADVSAGADEHEGWLLVEFCEAGAFEARNFVHVAARLFVPIGPGVPDKPAGSHPVQIRDKTEAGFVAVLPVIEWRKEIEARLAPKRPVSGDAAAKVSAPPPCRHRQRPAAGRGRVPEEQGSGSRAAGRRSLPGRRRRPAARPGRQADQRLSRQGGPRSAAGRQDPVRAA